MEMKHLILRCVRTGLTTLVFGSFLVGMILLRVYLARIGE